MLTLPKVIHREATPYIAVKAMVRLPFDDQVPAILGKLFGYVKANNLQETGPVFFKHNVVDMPTIEMEFGVPVDRLLQDGQGFVTGVLPAGDHAEITYVGPYDDLITVNAVLIGWAYHTGLTFDSRKTAEGEWFANRLEVFHNSPDEEPDPRKLQTTVTIKLKG